MYFFFFLLLLLPTKSMVRTWWYLVKEQSRAWVSSTNIVRSSFPRTNILNLHVLKLVVKISGTEWKSVYVLLHFKGILHVWTGWELGQHNCQNYKNKHVTEEHKMSCKNWWTSLPRCFLSATRRSHFTNASCMSGKRTVRNCASKCQWFVLQIFVWRFLET